MSPGNFVADIEEEAVYRAWMNIITNSVEHGKEGGRIRLTIRRGADQIALVTEDDGCGFSEEELVRGTEQFYQETKAAGSAAIMVWDWRLQEDLPRGQVGHCCWKIQKK